MPDLTRYQQRRRAGRCVDCGKSAQGKGSRCLKHALSERKRAQKRRLALAAAGTCQRCRKLPAVRGGICDGCREKLPTLPSSQGPNITHARRAENWQCKTCGEDMPSDLFKNCEGCRGDAAQARQTQREEMLSAGRCVCGAPLVKNSLRMAARLGRKLPTVGSRCKTCRNRRRKNDRSVDEFTSRANTRSGAPRDD